MHPRDDSLALRAEDETDEVVEQGAKGLVLVDVEVEGAGDGVGAFGRHAPVDGQDFDAPAVDVGEPDVADASGIAGDFLGDALVAGHFKGVGAVVAGGHGELLECLVGAGCGVAGVGGEGAGTVAERGPVGEVSGKDALDLPQGDVPEGVGLIDDDGNAVGGDLNGSEGDAAGTSLGQFHFVGLAGGHADFSFAVDQGGDAGGGTFSGDFEGDFGAAGLHAGFEGLGQLRDEFRPEGVGALDEDGSGGECWDRKDEGRCYEKEFLDHGRGRMVRFNMLKPVCLETEKRITDRYNRVTPGQ